MPENYEELIRQQTCVRIMKKNPTTIITITRANTDAFYFNVIKEIPSVDLVQHSLMSYTQVSNKYGEKVRTAINEL